MKGFAPVTLNKSDAASHRLPRFPYDRDSVQTLTNNDDDSPSVEESEAQGRPPYADQRALGYSEYRENLSRRITTATSTEPASPNQNAHGPPDEPERAPAAVVRARLRALRATRVPI
ncbi:hypothetical protein H4582DRAFT_2092894 [Lactarius indigo]|nr:hypothetical protein H4582DRAFT_2092894 [Lactarius indigo]